MDATTTNGPQVSSSHIPDDIAFSIISKLPLKSLKRFSCVQKSWSALFENPHFINMFCHNFFKSKHDDEDNDKTCLLLKERTQSSPVYHSVCILSGERFENRVKLDLPTPFQYNDNSTFSRSYINILGSGSVNGTICLYGGLCAYFPTTILWNPVTGEFKLIPPSFQPYWNIELNLPPVGFGYDSFKEDYKVIHSVNVKDTLDSKDEWIYLPNKSDPFWETDVHELDLNDNFWKEEKFIVDSTIDPFWEIYSLKSNSWRKLNGINMPIPSPGKSHVNLNEFSHWLSIEDGMVSFDFSKEMFFTTALPSDLNVILTPPVESNLVVLNGYVSLIYNYNMTYFHIWILGELGVKESWRKFCIIGPSSCFMRFMGVGKKSHIFFKAIRSNELALLDFSTMIEETWITGDSVCEQIVIYKENLLPFGG